VLPVPVALLTFVRLAMSLHRTLRKTRFLVVGALLLPLFSIRAATPSVTIVDLMVLYTPAAEEAAGGPVQIQAEIQAGVCWANVVFANSRINTRIRLVHSASAPYEETHYTSTDLSRLRDRDDGFLDEAHNLRDAYAADLVCLVTAMGSDYWFYGLQGPSAANAFSVIRHELLDNNFWLPVVLGFNFGCQLERPAADSTAAFPFSYGYTFVSSYGTTFSTADGVSGIRLPWFSNPEISIEETPSGVPEGDPNAANNAKTVNLTAPTVAAFRGSAATVIPPVLDNFYFALDPPTNLISVRADTNITLVAETSGSIQRVEFWTYDYDQRKLSLLGTDTGAPFTLTLSNLLSGRRAFVAQAIDHSGIVSAHRELWAEIAPAPPLNDIFADAFSLGGTNITLTSDNSAATSEAGEAWHATRPPGRSLWWRWTCPTTAVYRLRATSSQFRPVLAIYIGDELSSLVEITSGYDFGEIQLLFRGEQGVAYYFAVDGRNSAGVFDLSLSTIPAPTNDDFANATILSGFDLTIGGSSLYASHEPGEPAHHPLYPTEGSIWWRWTAPATGMAVISASGTNPASRVIAAYSGSSLTNLTLLDRFVAYWESPKIALSVTQDQSLVIAYDTSIFSGGPGAVTLHVGLHLPPANDHFSNRVHLAGAYIVVTNSNALATSEPEEPSHGEGLPQRSIWWSWTAPTDGYAVLASTHTVAVYTGDSLAQLVPVTLSEPVGFFCNAGQTYQIAADGPPDTVTLHLLLSTVHIVTPLDSFNYIPGTNVTIKAETTPLDGAIRSVEFLINSNLFVVVTNPPYSVVWNNAPAGVQAVQVLATDNTGLVHPSPVIHIAGKPANDDFADSILLAGTNVFASTDSFGATRELHEPFDWRFSSALTVWYSWTALADGRAHIVTTGNSGNFGPFVFFWAYSGSTISNLTLLANNEFVWQYIGNSGSFLVTAGETYHIALAPYGSTSLVGFSLTLQPTPRPLNDTFAERMLLTGFEGQLNSHNTNATTEPGEPLHVDTTKRSVWWTWTAPASGLVKFTNRLPSSQCALAVYMGGSLTNLTRVASSPLSTALSVEVLEGTTYQIAVDGVSGSYGPISIQLELPMPSPVNDSFTSRAVLSGNSLTVTGPPTLLAATSEPGEPFASGTRSVWWTWTAPTNGAFTLSVTSAVPDLVWKVYTGETVGTVTEVLSSGSRGSLTFRTAQGARYHIVAATVSAPAFPARYGFSLDFQPSYITITRPLPDAVFFTNRFDLESMIDPAFGVVESVDYVAVDHGLLGSSSEPPFTTTFVGSFERSYQIYAQATNASGQITLSDTIVVSTRYPRLSNDEFADRTLVFGTNLTLSGSNADASKEAGEPNHGNNSGGHSVWWSWRSAVRGDVFITFNGSTFQTTLGVYRGASLDALTAVPMTLSDGVYNFYAEADTDYLIAVDGASGSSGQIILDLRLVAPQPNDHFADRIELFGTNVFAFCSTIGATKEPGEPNHGPGGHPPGRRSVWFTWTALGTGPVVLDVGTTYVTLASLYTGSSLSNLTLVSNGSFNAVAGTTYQIAFDNYFAGTSFEFLLLATDGVVNDHFTNRVFLTGASLTVTSHNYAATMEPGEPVWPGFPGGSSVWWSWTAPGSGRLSLSFLKKYLDYPVSLNLFTGDSLTNLVRRLDWGVVEGETYHIQLQGYSGEQGYFVLQLDGPIAPPPNDDFVDRILLSGPSLSVTGWTHYASIESGEPNAHRSVWWSWTAPSSGRFFVRTIGSPQETPIGVFRGTNVANLTSVTSMTRDYNAISFDTVAGTTYEIAVLAYYVSTGFTLELGPYVPWTNDDFVNRYTLGGDAGTFKGTNVYATSEPGERRLTTGRGATLWWSWEAPDNGVLQLFVRDVQFGGGVPGSGPQQWGPLIGVFTGTVVSNLALLATNNYYLSGYTFPWRVTNATAINVVRGRTYHIAVDGCNESAGSFAMDWAFSAGPRPPGPINDDFLNSLTLSGNSDSIQSSNTFATGEAGEPSHAGQSGGASVWFTWTAPLQTGRTFVWVSGSNWLPLLAVYTGGAVSNLAPVAAAVGGSLSFYTVAGATYRIAVDGANGIAGQFSLNVQFVEQPDNDYFANRILLVGTNTSFVSETSAASTETGERPPDGSTGNTIWWSWVAPAKGRLVFMRSTNSLPAAATLTESMFVDEVMDELAGFESVRFPRPPWPPFPPPPLAPPGSSTGPSVAIYTGDDLTNLVLVGSNAFYYAGGGVPAGWRVLENTELLVSEGVTYQISVDGINGSSGHAAFDLAFHPAPNNDDFSRSIVFSGNELASVASTQGASAEVGEPNHAGSPAHASLWWTWTPPGRGGTRIDVAGPVAPRVGVYEGSALSNLVQVTAGAFETHFHVSAGDIRHIALDSTARADFSVTFSFVPSPANDDFTNSFQVSGSSFSASGSNMGASSEMGEPAHGGEPSEASLWWAWTAPYRGRVRIDLGSEFGPRIAVYSGNSLSNLVELAHGGVELTFDAQAGAVYYIALDGSGRGNFVWNLVSIPAPANDLFANRRHIQGTSLTITGSTVNASSEFGEPGLPGLAPWATGWYSWTAPASGRVSLIDHESLTTSAVFVGSALGTLFRVAEGAAVLHFYALAGTTYQIAVAGYSEPEIDFSLQLLAPPSPPSINNGGSTLLGGGSFRFIIAGANGQSFAVQASTNLIDWNTLLIDTMQTTSFVFDDLEPATYPHKFYRVLPLEILIAVPSLRVEVVPPDVSGFAVRVVGPGAQPFTLEASTNLTEWTPLGSALLRGNSFEFIDTESQTAPSRFYRAVPIR
jgi:hypothetical protein